ncbi:hypothetical protein ACOMHN_031792 [Nucella lapillus]
MSSNLAGLTLGVATLTAKCPAYNRSSPVRDAVSQRQPAPHHRHLPAPGGSPQGYKSSKLNNGDILSSSVFSSQDVSARRGQTSGQQTCPGVTMVVGEDLRTGGPDLHVRIILLGDYSVGKSSLLQILARHSKKLSQDKEEKKQHQHQHQHQHQRERCDQTISHLALSESSESAMSEGSEESALSDSSGSCSSDTLRSWRGGVGDGDGKGRGRWVCIRSCLQPGEFVEVEFLHHYRRVLARVTDTGGQERYRSMTTSYYRGAHGCLLMFDVTKEDTFTNLDTWIENIDRYKTADDFPCILVGTRCKSPARCISFDRATEFAENRGLPYMELDMGHMTDVRRVFEALLESVTVSVNKNCAPIAISIRPDISHSKDVMVQNHIGCAC